MIYKDLGDRLARIIHIISGANMLADVGTDHGLVPRRLIDLDLIERAILTDVAPGPLSRAREALKDEKYKGLVDFRLGDGLSVIDANEVDCVTIAGIGGEAITKILNDDLEKTKSLGRLVLSPNNASDVLRRWLFEQNYYIINDSLVSESKKITEIIHASTQEYTVLKNGKILHGKPYRHDEPVDFEISNIQRKEGGKLFYDFIANRLWVLKTIIKNIEDNQDGFSSDEKYLEVEEHYEQYEKILNKDD